MGYYHPATGGQKKIADMYDVQGANRSNRPGAYAKPGNENRTVNDVSQDISKAMQNDYDTREFLKYNKDARKKLDKGIPMSRKDNEAVYGMMKDAHKDAGNGGKYSSAADMAGVSQNAFEDHMSQYKMKGSGKKKDKEPQEEQAAPEAEVTYSPEMQQAKERAQNYESNATEGLATTNSGIHKQHDFSGKSFQAA